MGGHRGRHGPPRDGGAPARGALRGFCVRLTTGAAEAAAARIRRARLPDVLAHHALDRYAATTAGEMWEKFGLSAPCMDVVHLPFARATYARGVADTAAAAAAAGIAGAGGILVLVTDTVDGAESVATTTTTIVAAGEAGAGGAAEAPATAPGRGGEAAADGGLTALQALLALQVADVTDAEPPAAEPALPAAAAAGAPPCDLAWPNSGWPVAWSVPTAKGCVSDGSSQVFIVSLALARRPHSSVARPSPLTRSAPEAVDRDLWAVRPG